MYNRLYTYLNDDNLLYKQFGFREGYSTYHVLSELINSMCDSSNLKYATAISQIYQKLFEVVD